MRRGGGLRRGDRKQDRKAGRCWSRPSRCPPTRGQRGNVSAACLSCDIYRRKLGLKMKVILLPRRVSRHCDDEDVEERRTMGVLPRRPTHLSEMEAFLES